MTAPPPVVMDPLFSLFPTRHLRSDGAAPPAPVADARPVCACRGCPEHSGPCSEAIPRRPGRPPKECDACRRANRDALQEKRNTPHEYVTVTELEELRESARLVAILELPRIAWTMFPNGNGKLFVQDRLYEGATLRAAVRRAENAGERFEVAA